MKKKDVLYALRQAEQHPSSPEGRQAWEMCAEELAKARIISWQDLADLVNPKPQPLNP